MTFHRARDPAFYKQLPILCTPPSIQRRQLIYVQAIEGNNVTGTCPLDESVIGPGHVPEMRMPYDRPGPCEFRRKKEIPGDFEI